MSGCPLCRVPFVGFPTYDSQTIALAGQRAFLLGRDGSLVYDVANPTAPELIGLTRSKGRPLSGCAAGKYFYVGELSGKERASQGIAVYDISNPQALREVGFTATDRGVYDVFAIRRNRLLASLDGELNNNGPWVNGNAQIFDLQNPQQLSLLARTTEAGGLGEESIKHDLTFDKRVHLIPEARLIITIPASNDRLILYVIGG